MSTTSAGDDTSEYPVRCHCGRIRATVECNRNNLVAWDCNCSDCDMRKNIHFIVASSKLRLEHMDESLENATTLYEWGSKTAKRRFCKTCGILPFYTPRSNANDGIAVTLACVDFGDDRPHVEIRKFDGQNWEKSFADSHIAEQSK